MDRQPFRLGDGIEPKGWDDIEQQSTGAEAYLTNDTVSNISWQGVTVTAKDRETKQPKTIVDNIEGYVQAGEICAFMGPSGCGKTTLLNVLAARPPTAGSVAGSVLLDGRRPSRAAMRRLTGFVEQEDALIGSLTVRETVAFAARLSGSGGNSSSTKTPTAGGRDRIVDDLVEAFGLRAQARALIGTPLRKGISGGQKRRVGVASQLITAPKVLFLDEPTSGLDSAASWEVVDYLRQVAKRNKLIVIASIHQPSTATLQLFDKLLLLSCGRTHYFGPVAQLGPHYEAVGRPIPVRVNPAEHLLDLINVDFAARRGRAPDDAATAVAKMQREWAASARAADLSTTVALLGDASGSSSSSSSQMNPRQEPQRRQQDRQHAAADDSEMANGARKPGLPILVLTLLHRSFIKSYRDVVAYGIRMAMYIAFGIMLGTVWLRLDATQTSIIPITNAIFYGSAFMSFMAVAYVPAFLEDRMQYVKEHANGMYSAAAFLASNFLIGLPYLFSFALVFSAVSYWLSNFQPTAHAFSVWTLWLFLDLVAAESLVVLVACAFPSFVVALAVVAFANGLWMSVDGFMVSPTRLNGFYRYVFHYWDYQKYVFENMMINEFAHREYACGAGCHCMYQSDLADRCMIRGQAVLDQYGYRPGHMGRDLGIMMGIIAGYRLAAWLVLVLRR